jgi:hypothetical protein
MRENFLYEPLMPKIERFLVVLPEPHRPKTPWWTEEAGRTKIRQKGSTIVFPQNLFHNWSLIFHVLHWNSLKQKRVNLLVNRIAFESLKPKEVIFGLNRIADLQMGYFSWNRTWGWISQTRPRVIFPKTISTWISPTQMSDF